MVDPRVTVQAGLPLQHCARCPNLLLPLESEACAAALRQVDLDPGLLGQPVTALSGGQRQRIAIARALLVNPPVLILDDATSAIDVQVEQAIHAGLHEHMTGRTTLIIAHRLSTISLADRVVLLDGHRVVADGTHAELLATTPLYAEVLAQAAEFEAEHDDGAAGETPDGALAAEGVR